MVGGCTAPATSNSQIDSLVLLNSPVFRGSFGRPEGQLTSFPQVFVVPLCIQHLL